MRESRKERHGDGATRRQTEAEKTKRSFSTPALMSVLVIVAIVSSSCTMKASRSGILPEVDAVISTVGDDIDNGRYEKIYNEAAEQWRQDSTPEQSNATFNTLRTKLGKVGSRRLHSATEGHSSGLGHSFVVAYETRFERGEGMETFTLVERDGHWMMARYFVNSTALK